jgi:tetratricopeptide (TPR) repeat protein
MTLDDLLAAYASQIPRTPRAELVAGLAALEEEYERRRHDDLARARAAAFLESLDMEEAAYDLGRRHAAEGNLEEAVRWYGKAARSDHGDAALRLGEVLEVLAERARAEPSASYSRRREELYLIREAAHAYAEAYAAGYLEAADKVDRMLADLHSRERTPETAGVAEPACAFMDDFDGEAGDLTEAAIQTISHHAAHCLTCMEEFVKLIVATATASQIGLPQR